MFVKFSVQESITMELTTQQQQKVVDYLTMNGADQPCSACRGNGMEVSPTVISLNVYQPEQQPTILAVIVECRKCSYARLFLADRMNLFE